MKGTGEYLPKHVLVLRLVENGLNRGVVTYIKDPFSEVTQPKNLKKIIIVTIIRYLSPKIPQYRFKINNMML